ncbi:MAG: hypothetical protein OEU54_00005, partial [Gemmatimonadota bacterium]|nr:hypothetical protein [Gemmatimonadota bacterium]
RALRCFDVPALTGEDRDRAAMYRARREVAAETVNVESVDDWLRSLGSLVHVERLGDANRVRAAQLLNKTNQMNLATRRMSEAGLVGWAADEAHEFWTFGLADRFGDHGVTGLLGLARVRDSLEVVDFVMSCRVLGRNLERSMIAWAVGRARDAGLRRLVARYRPTGKNRPCLDFLRSSGLLEVDETAVFEWAAAESYAVPEGVDLRGPAERRTTPA